MAHEKLFTKLSDQITLTQKKITHTVVVSDQHSPDLFQDLQCKILHDFPGDEFQVDNFGNIYDQAALTRAKQSNRQASRQMFRGLTGNITPQLTLITAKDTGFLAQFMQLVKNAHESSGTTYQTLFTALDRLIAKHGKQTEFGNQSYSSCIQQPRLTGFTPAPVPAVAIIPTPTPVVVQKTKAQLKAEALQRKKERMRTQRKR
ncbi:MAG TPA: hypothetical protein QF353_01570 [Gammaproteobacteria bacterium]|nr:hypothetical protein [Gammaproteobacteria bacterium]